jgi:membrane protease YdiL (CAAX protease family)
MPSVLECTSARLLASSPNYLEVTIVITVVAASRFLFKLFWSFSPRLCVSTASVAVVFLYACLGKGQIFTLSHLGCAASPGVLDLCGSCGCSRSVGALFILRGTGLSVGSAPATEFLYGVALGPVIEEVIFRGAAFSVVYVTACSAKVLMHWRIGISLIVTSLLFVWSHTRTIAIPCMVIFLIGIAYALLRWRSNSTATSALMHAIYNGVIAIVMVNSTAG